MAATLSRGIAGVGRFMRKEFVATWPLFLFFLTGFVLLILLIKLTLAQFSIQMTVLSRAVVGAWLAAKTAIVFDETPLARRLDHYRRIVAVTVKTFFYATVGLFLGYLEKFLEASHEIHGFHGSIQYTISHPDRIPLLARVMGIAIVFALYFSFVEISRRMGEGELWRLFFESPGIRKLSDRP